MKKKKFKKENKRLEDAMNRISSKKGQWLETKTPSCETCKYKGFDVLFTDSPCYGCTAGNYKMYEPKENQNE